jgi:putative membrane protein
VGGDGKCIFCVNRFHVAKVHDYLRGMDYNIIKSLHIIFVVTWFAGLFYMFRLFVYHAEAEGKDNPERDILLRQYRLMEYRLWYIITWPSCVLTLFFGTTLLYLNPGYLSMPWMHLKLFFILCLLMYQWKGQKLYSKGLNWPIGLSSFKLRMWNEVGTILLVAIVFVVVNKDSISWLWGALGLVGLGVLLTLAIKAYKRVRTDELKK